LTDALTFLHRVNGGSNSSFAGTTTRRLKKFNITKLFVRVRVEYVDVTGKIVIRETADRIRPARAPHLYYPCGDALT
jgi:hypothetical protein